MSKWNDLLLNSCNNDDKSTFSKWPVVTHQQLRKIIQGNNGNNDNDSWHKT